MNASLLFGGGVVSEI